MFDFLVVRIGIKVVRSGSVYVEARLKDKNGRQIMWAEKELDLEANQLRVAELRFDGKLISKHEVDGPYYLTDLLVNHIQPKFDVEHSVYVEHAYTTSDYKVTNFERVSTP